MPTVPGKAELIVLRDDAAVCIQQVRKDARWPRRDGMQNAPGRQQSQCAAGCDRLGRGVAEQFDSIIKTHWRERLRGSRLRCLARAGYIQLIDLERRRAIVPVLVGDELRAGYSVAQDITQRRLGPQDVARGLRSAGQDHRGGRIEPAIVEISSLDHPAKAIRLDIFGGQAGNDDGRRIGAAVQVAANLAQVRVVLGAHVRVDGPRLKVIAPGRRRRLAQRQRADSCHDDGARHCRLLAHESPRQPVRRVHQPEGGQDQGGNQRADQPKVVRPASDHAGQQADPQPDE